MQQSTQKYVPYVSQGWQGLVRNGWLEPLANLDEFLSAPADRVLANRPNREVRRVVTEHGVLYVKIIKSLSDDRGCNPATLWKHLKWCLRPSRALAVLQVSEQMLSAGIICPEPVLAARQRRWGYPCDVFITREVRAPTLNQLLVEATDKQQRQQLLEIAARELSHFHQLGFIHGDCLLGNFCLHAGHLAFLDNDRSFRSTGWLLQYHRRRNLQQFCHLLSWRLCNTAGARWFLERYAVYSGWSAGQAARESQLIMAKVRRRLANTIIDQEVDDWLSREREP